MTIVIIVLSLFTLTACDQQALREKIIPKEEVEFSKHYLSLFQARDFDAIEKKIAPDLRDSQLRIKLEQLAAFFPSEKPTEINDVGSHTFSSADLWQANLSFQYKFPGKWLLANVALQKKGSELMVTGVHVQPLKDSLENLNRFSLEGRGMANYIFLAMATIVPLFIIFALVQCIRTPVPKRKWLWLIFILLGFVQITMNWTDGSVHINPLYFQLLGVGFIKGSQYAPVLISISIPLGAILFMSKRKIWLALSTQENASEPGLDNEHVADERAEQ
jgi:hypothetical protein